MEFALAVAECVLLGFAKFAIILVIYFGVEV